ncbi:ABC transporter substrate-binding protein [Gordonia neofelifaecis]|uniref:ABC-type Fe3+-hydroxamate transport system periplasmic component-like protein n=1 Tax=Gordonia neofelifaecis NRRL B-59395 TaxID=644548 RepID=F1YJ31_9ACTN|nr:ABC transporter substrate-binding protein [Gordonia neofelifaecis]EGD55489.1 ABC-type Fe3+-hydroxamate transport system periplasmic component-like protein [Gordonia neofelifaecis NRRL B-59395]
MRSPRISALLAGAAVIVPLVAAGCSTPQSDDAGASRECITDFDPAKDYFPDKSTIEDATGLRIEYHNSYQVVTVEHPAQGAPPASYVLVRCGAPAPKLTGDLASAPQVQVPVRSIYAGSTTHLPALAALGESDAVTGVATAGFVSTPEIVKRIDEGKVREFTDAGEVNAEKVIAGHPDVLVTDGNDSPAFGKITAAGVPVIANADWLEENPLGRAEWIKFFAALTGTEKKAATVFGQVQKQYRAVADKLVDVPKTDVLLGEISNGSWTMASGGSYFGRLVADAGGTYPWIDDPAAGSLQLSIEAVIARSRNASAWLLSDPTVSTVADLYKQDPRYRAFTTPAQQAWNSTKAVNAAGGNDYWEKGVLRPDLVLSDLAAILHPDLFPDHSFEFYLHLPPQ